MILVGMENIGLCFLHIIQVPDEMLTQFVGRNYSRDGYSARGSSPMGWKPCWNVCEDEGGNSAIRGEAAR